MGKFFFTSGGFCRCPAFSAGGQVRVGTGALARPSRAQLGPSLKPPHLLELFLDEHQLAVFDFEIFHVAGKPELIALLGEFFLQHFVD